MRSLSGLLTISICQMLLAVFCTFFSRLGALSNYCFILTIGKCTAIQTVLVDILEGCFYLFTLKNTKNLTNPEKFLDDGLLEISKVNTRFRKVQKAQVEAFLVQKSFKVKRLIGPQAR